MRANRGFTLIELMVVVALIGIVASLVVWQGRSARQAADIAGGAYDLALQMGGIKGRALADGRDHLLVVVDALDPAGCEQERSLCGRALVLRNPQAGFSIAGFDPDPPIAGADFVEETFLPRNTRFDLAATWRPPAPFNAVQAFDPLVTASCADGRSCFAIRFRADGEVEPEFPAARAARAGFAFVLRPVDAPSAAAERRGLFVSFPAGIVKTAAF